MKKLLTLSLCLFCIISITACGNGQKAQELYDAIGSISFSDESILNSDELSKLETMREQKEQYFKDKDVDGLTTLQEEWSSFRQPIDDYIEQYQMASSTFFSGTDEALLTDDELQACKEMEEKITDAYQSRDNDVLSKSIDEWNSYSDELREVINTYNEINQSPFDGTADKDLLSSETLDEMENLSAATENALTHRDVAALKSLKSEWYTFTENANTEIETAKENLLKDWVDNANVTNSFTNLFSLGTVTSSTSIDGHKVTYTTQYNYDIDESEVKSAMDSYLSWTSSVFESGISSLKTYVDDVCIRVEYKDKNGNVISYKEF